MPFTGRLGTSDSYLGNVVLGISSFTATVELNLSDNLTVLTDDIRLLKTYLTSFSEDTNNYNIAVNVVLGKHYTFSDQLEQFLDDISFYKLGLLNVNLSEVLQQLETSLSFIKLNTVSPQQLFKPFYYIYLRRYLNDVVVRDDNEVLQTTTQVLYKPFFYKYVRRYLNDVVEREL